MCRNIRTLHNFDPPATQAEVHAAAEQFVRKISGVNRPSRTNAQPFARAIERVADAASALLGELETKTPPRNRAVEAAKAKARSALRFKLT